MKYVDIKGCRYKGCSIEQEPFNDEYHIYDAWDRLIGVETSLVKAKDAVNEFLSEPERKEEGYGE